MTVARVFSIRLLDSERQKLQAAADATYSFSSRGVPLGVFIVRAAYREAERVLAAKAAAEEADRSTQLEPRTTRQVKGGRR